MNKAVFLMKSGNEIVVNTRVEFNELKNLINKEGYAAFYEEINGKNIKTVISKGEIEAICFEEGTQNNDSLK